MSERVVMIGTAEYETHRRAVADAQSARARGDAEGFRDAIVRAETAVASATIRDRIIDPDCRDGKHKSCVGDPCDCYCHTEERG